MSLFAQVFQSLPKHLSSARANEELASHFLYVEITREKCRGQRQGQEDLEYVNDDMKLIGVQPEWAVFRDMWKDFISARII